MGRGQTDRQTHTHTRTCQLLDQLGPEGRVGEKSINGFPIVFSKSDFGGGDTFFCQNCCLKKPNTPKYAQVTWAKLNSVTALLSPSPTSRQNPPIQPNRRKF